ncbi:unnamed protein product, partial [Ectocarpus sp. 13 AM-2016]
IPKQVGLRVAYSPRVPEDFATGMVAQRGRTQKASSSCAEVGSNNWWTHDSPHSSRE